MNRARRKGTDAESKVAWYFAERGLAAFRAPLHGTIDRGDVWAAPTPEGFRVVVQVKAGAQADSPTPHVISQWTSATALQASRVPTCTLPLLVLKRRRSAKVLDWVAWARVGDVDATVSGAARGSALDERWISTTVGEVLDVVAPPLIAARQAQR